MAKPRGRGRVKKKKGGAPAPRKRRPRLSAEELDWKNFPSLRRFLSERGKIRSRRITGLSRRQQNQLAGAVKRARTMGLLIYPDQDRRVRAHASTQAPPPAAPAPAEPEAVGVAAGPAEEAPEVSEAPEAVVEAAEE
jgi:small subunit ribosomal protein S18